MKTLRFFFGFAAVLLLAGCSKSGEAEQPTGTNSQAAINNNSPVEESQPVAETSTPAVPEQPASQPQLSPEQQRRDQLQQALADAVTQGDGEKVREFLAGGAQPDRAEGTNATPLEIAVRLALKANEAGDPKPFTIFLELCHHVRHRDARLVELEGDIAMIAGGGGNTPQLEATDGNFYLMAFSVTETSCRSAEIADGKFDIKFKRQYRVRGCLTKQGILEVEQLELVFVPESELPRRRTGWEFGLPLLLPSTERQWRNSQPRD